MAQWIIHLTQMLYWLYPSMDALHKYVNIGNYDYRVFVFYTPFLILYLSFVIASNNSLKRIIWVVSTISFVSLTYLIEINVWPVLGIILYPLLILFCAAYLIVSILSRYKMPNKLLNTDVQKPHVR